VVDGHGQWYEDRNAEQLFDELESAVGRFEWNPYRCWNFHCRGESRNR
jgi:hypothetical protein